MHIHIYVGIYTCRYSYIETKSLACVFSLFLKAHYLEQMEIKRQFSALVPKRGHHKVQNRVRASCEQPQGTDASAKEEGEEIRREE